ncbi:MAG: hypothetical protein IPJ49_14480 [Candidatus Obscuribacter sp.]|nr:hypothetical protein [Candidatus Obscuribacter sp.]
MSNIKAGKTGQLNCALCVAAVISLSFSAFVSSQPGHAKSAKQDSASESSKEDAKAGRAGSWRTNTQGAPSVEACRKRVAAKPDDAIAHNDLGWASASKW